MIRIKAVYRWVFLGFFLGVPPVIANPSPYPHTDYPVSFSDIKALPVAQGAIPHSYGSAPSQYGLLWLPVAPRPAPLVMIVHGDCWLSDYDVEHIQPFASALVRAGYAVWAPEYRRIGESGGGWPGMIDDLRAALALAARLEPGRINPERTVLVGHAAGGHLALWLATRRQPVAADVTVLGTVGLSAITDLALYRGTDNNCAAVVETLFDGDSQTQTARYREASPARSENTALPVQLLHGSDDQVVPVAQSRAMPGAELEVLQGAGHYDLIHPGTSAFPAVLRAIDAVLSP